MYTKKRKKTAVDQHFLPLNGLNKISLKLQAFQSQPLIPPSPLSLAFDINDS